MCPAWWAPCCLAGTPPAMPGGRGWPGLAERARGELTAWVQLPWVCSVQKNLLPCPTGNLCLFWGRWSASLQVRCWALGHGASRVRASGRFWCESRGAARAALRSCSPGGSKFGLGGRHPHLARCLRGSLAAPCLPPALGIASVTAEVQGVRPGRNIQGKGDVCEARPRISEPSRPPPPLGACQLPLGMISGKTFRLSRALSNHHGRKRRRAARRSLHVAASHGV